MKNFILLGVMLCLLNACKEKIDTSKLDNTKWELTAMPGITLPANAKATLNFADSLKVSGKSFCNSYGGKAEVSDNKIALKNFFGTKMFCQETDAAERFYLHTLNQVDGAKVTDEKLYLLNGKKTLMEFSKVN